MFRNVSRDKKLEVNKISCRKINNIVNYKNRNYLLKCV